MDPIWNGPNEAGRMIGESSQQKAQCHAAALCDLDRPKSSPVQPSLDSLRGRLRDTQEFLESKRDLTAACRATSGLD
jgi:hypothetical protein